MSLLNQKSTVVVSNAKGLSGNGNLQDLKSPEQSLFEIVISSLYGKDSFYESAETRVVRMIVALDKVVAAHGAKGARFAMRVARFAREEMFIRTMPIVMTVQLAKILRDRNIQLDGFKDAAAYLIQRADELTDMYAYALTVFGDKKSIPQSIKKGVAQAFNKFDAYQFGKYNGSNSLKFKDLLRIVHPKPNDDIHTEIFSKIMSETLEAPHTWEVELSKNGQLGDDQKPKAQIWSELIHREGTGSLGYMALLRNLRNMKEANVSDEDWMTVAVRLCNPVAVSKSKQLPFGFINAYEQALKAGCPSVILNALTSATEHAFGNMPEMGERVWIILDCSGSMNHFSHDPNRFNSESASNSPIKIGAIFACALMKASKGAYQVNLTMFDDHAKTVPLNPHDSIFTMYEQVMARNAGGGTDLQSALNAKKGLGWEPDTVIVLSDMEVNQLRSTTNPAKYFTDDCVKVAVNLNSRDTTPLPDRAGWIQLAGWSERIFQFVKFTRNTDGIVKQLFDEN